MIDVVLTIYETHLFDVSRIEGLSGFVLSDHEQVLPDPKKWFRLLNRFVSNLENLEKCRNSYFASFSKVREGLGRFIVSQVGDKHPEQIFNRTFCFMSR